MPTARLTQKVNKEAHPALLCNLFFEIMSMIIYHN